MIFNELSEKDLIMMDNRIDSSSNDKNEYKNLNYIYRKLFTEYIINKTNLKTFDNILKESDLKFKIVNIKDIDSYQYFTFEDLKYFYVRNNIYIEHLTDEEKEFFTKKINNNDYCLDDETAKMIEKTFKKVISKNDIDEKYEVFYGPLSSSFMTLSTNIVIGFRYDEFNDDGLSDDEWDALHNKQMEFLENLVSNLIKGNTELTVFQYSEFSTIPREEFINK